MKLSSEIENNKCVVLRDISALHCDRDEHIIPGLLLQIYDILSKTEEAIDDLKKNFIATKLVTCL